MKKHETTLVKDILPTVLGSISCRDITDQISLEKLWQDTLAADAHLSVITGFKDGCISAQVDNPTMLFKMRLRRQEILKKLNSQRKDIVNLIFKIGKTR